MRDDKAIGQAVIKQIFYGFLQVFLVSTEFSMIVLIPPTDFLNKLTICQISFYSYGLCIVFYYAFKKLMDWQCETDFTQHFSYQHDYEIPFDLAILKLLNTLYGFISLVLLLIHGSFLFMTGIMGAVFLLFVLLGLLFGHPCG